MLGAGGMGVVYEAVDRERNARVALKTLKKAHPVAIARFKREFRSVADVVHPNLVALYELVADRNDLFFTMELIHGAPFSRWVRRLPEADPTEIVSGTSTDTDDTRDARPPQVSAEPAPGDLDVARLRLAMRQLAEGVAAIHQAGMLHRDLKPSNVMVAAEDRVVILDFGLVTDIAEESLLVGEDRPLEGTAAYMSPEQGARLALTPASDWYSVGVMLYGALTGRKPFLGGRDDVLMDKQRFEPPPPRELVPGVPADLDALCVELLRREPERRPSGVDVLRRLGSAVEASARSTSIGSSHAGYDMMVGREAELAALDAALRDSRSGRAVLVHLSGPSGMGKSRIVRAFVDALQTDETTVLLRGRCYERESVPFKAVDSLIDDLGKYLAQLPALDVEGLMPRDALSLARVFPVLRQVEAFTSRRRRSTVSPDPQELRRRAFVALRELLVRIADRGPVVLAIDDLQWGDIDSAALLASLLRPPDPPALLLIASYRSEDAPTSSFLQLFTEQTSAGGIDTRRVEVGPLDEELASQLAMVHLGERGDLMPLAEQIARESRGNPLFVEELSRHLRDRGADRAQQVSLSDVMRNRVLRLPTPAGRLLSIVAVAGRPMAQSVAMRASGVTDPAMLSLLKAGSFVRTRSAGGERFVEPYHDRVRETAVALLDEDALRNHHQRLAEVFEASPRPDPETLAVHYYGSGDVVRAAEFAAVAAARAAESLAFDRAARLYQFALSLHQGGADRRLMLVALGDALVNAGRGAQAADAYFQAVDGAPRAEALYLQCRAASQLLFSGHIDRGVQALEAVSAEVGMKTAGTPARALASLLWKRLHLALRGLRFKEKDEREIPATQLMRVDVAFQVTEGLGMADVIRAAELQVTGLLLALKTGEPRRIARALVAEAVITSYNGVSARKRTSQILQTVNELAERLDDPGIRGIALGGAGVVAFNYGGWRECYEKCREGEMVFRDECTGYRWELATTQMFQGFALSLMAEVRAMLDRFPTLIEEARDRGDLYAETSLRSAMGLYVPLSNDDPETARRELDEAIAQWSPHGFHLQHANALNSRACIELYRGDVRAASEACESQWRALRRSLLMRGQLMRGLMWSARCRSALARYSVDRDPKLLAIARKGARVLSRDKVDYIAGEVCNIQACIAMARGDRERALELLTEADRLLSSSGLMLNALCVRRTRGEMLGGDEGAELVRSVDDHFVGQGVRRPDRTAALFSPIAWYLS